MRTFSLGLMAICLIALPCRADETKEVVGERWSLMRINGADAGWMSEKTTRTVTDGQVRYRTEVASHLVLTRFKQKMVIDSSGWSVEDAEGRILQQRQTSKLSGRETVYDLVVEGDQAKLTITTLGKPRTLKLPWSKDVLGPIGVRRRMAKEGTQAGKTYTYKTFVPDYGRVMTVTVQVEGLVETNLLGGETARLCKAVSSNDVMPNLKSRSWYAADFTEVKNSLDMMGMKMESFQTTRQRATQPVGKGEGPEVLRTSAARSNVNLPSPYRLSSIVYRFKVKDPKLGMPKGLGDDRQTVLSNDGKTARVRIVAKVPSAKQTRPLADPKPELRDYLAPNAFLQSDYAKLNTKAHEVVGQETDAWKAACKLENFVYRHIADKNFGTGFASAAEVLENRTGDCSEHGVLLAAMCRSVGIPSRVALGYMYLGGIFAGHMWVEVWIAGEWYALDGVMGIGRVDPTHIRFSSSSLKGGGLSSNFATALQGLGNLEITVLEFAQGERVVKVGAGFKDYRIEGDTYTNVLRGIRITKPAGYSFGGLQKTKGLSFMLVKLEGKTPVQLRAIPAAFSFTFERFQRQFKGDGVEISARKRTVRGRPAYQMDVTNPRRRVRLVAILDQDTCYLVEALNVKGPADESALEKVVQTIEFVGD